MSRESNDKHSRIAKKDFTLMASLLSDSVIIVQVTVYIPSTADVYQKVEGNGWVETQNICVKKLIVPPKNIPCFDAHKEWPNEST